MQISQEQITSFQELWKREKGEDITRAQTLEYALNLLGLFEALIDGDAQIQTWNKRLASEPNGFPMPGNGEYTCKICYQRVSGNTGWYDQFGIKCRPCQKAIEDNVVPSTVATDRESWYSPNDLKEKFGWKHNTLVKKIRINELKTREIRNGEYHWYFIFLKDENPNVALIKPQENSR